LNGWTVLILILVLLPVGLLSLPLTFKAMGCLRTEEQQLEVRVAWGWGLLAAAFGIRGRKTSFGLRLAGIALPVSGKKPEKTRAKKIREKTVKKTGRKRERQGFNFFLLSEVLNRKLLAAVTGYLKSIFRSFRLSLQVSGVYGADDPALTGLVAGLTTSLRADHLHIDLEPDFSGPVLDVAGEMSGRVVPVVILLLTTLLFLAEPVRKIWWSRLKTKFIIRKPKEVQQNV